MATCFVIQPFDSRFDKLFADVYKPAIAAAGLEAYRVDKDPAAEIPIDSIEKGIQDSAICLADISENNPNVWYELGFALAAKRPVAMACNSARDKYPFDIQHRFVIRYATESSSDFERLRQETTERLKAQLATGAVLRSVVAESGLVAPTQGLSQTEIALVAAIAGETGLPSSNVSVVYVQNQVERSGWTSVAIGLAIRKLLAKQFIEIVAEQDFNGEPFDAVRLNSKGWDWVGHNENLFILRKPDPEAPLEETPF